MTAPPRTYLPAAGRDWLLPIYDPLTKLLGGDSIRREFLAQSALQPGMRVLDIGCGTGTLAVLARQLHPGVELVGLDPDPEALARARRKAARAGFSIQFDQGFSDELPYPEASFDRVFSTFMLHHVPRAGKLPTVREVRRVLKSGGSLHLMDLAPRRPGAGWLVRILHPSHRAAENTEDRIISLLREAGLSNPAKTAQRRMWFWPVSTYRASA